jgi:5-methylcytosine-specific restriction endonuclease McrA
LGKYYSERRGPIFDWSDEELVKRTREKMRKPHRITEKLLEAARKRGLELKGKRRNSVCVVCAHCGKEFLTAYCTMNSINPKTGQIRRRQYCSGECRRLASCKPEELKTDKTRLKEWRLKVLERDGYICQKCGCKRKRLLQAHHRRSKEECPESIYDVDNGETLCVYCHTKEHPKLKNFILSSLGLNLEVPYATGISRVRS